MIQTENVFIRQPILFLGGGKYLLQKNEPYRNPSTQSLALCAKTISLDAEVWWGEVIKHAHNLILIRKIQHFHVKQPPATKEKETGRNFKSVKSDSGKVTTCGSHLAGGENGKKRNNLTL